MAPEGNPEHMWLSRKQHPEQMQLQSNLPEHRYGGCPIFCQFIMPARRMRTSRPTWRTPFPPISMLESRVTKGGHVRVSDILPVNIDIGGAGAHETK